ncbi:hypothetical protein WKI71_42695 [Streptomyces sp. MS1.AVA.1]|uniref:Uncharacterized protein n=1 Tax=Streptomyces machairae TaxID=3134109 RepID=A0ABU8UUS6_9ACTN
MVDIAPQNPNPTSSSSTAADPLPTCERTAQARAESSRVLPPTRARAHRLLTPRRSSHPVTPACPSSAAPLTAQIPAIRPAAVVVE